jgi:hypothetical protein
VGTARREVVDHGIVLGEHHLRRILRGYVAYYNADRPHMGLGATYLCDAEGRRMNAFYATTTERNENLATTTP